jgi:two-component system response regulator MprA
MSTASQATSTPQTVLVVDDDPDIRLVLRMILEAQGYAVIDAADGAEALALLRDHRPALILLDLMMPGVDGVQFRALQQQDPALAPIPVVLLSGGGTVAKKAEEMGVEGFLAKPPELRQVLAEVERHCRP